MTKVMKFIWYWMFKFQHVTNLYCGWSRLYQKLFEQKIIKAHPLKDDVHTLDDLNKAFEKVEWRADSWLQLGDVISSPEKIQCVLDTGQQHLLGSDCDDFSMYAIAKIWCMIKDSRAGLDIIAAPSMMSVIWMDQGKQQGHNVCCFKYKHRRQVKYGHVSNWSDGRVNGGFSSLEDMALDICSHGYGNKFIAAQILKADLNEDGRFVVNRHMFMKNEHLSFKPTKWIWS